MMKDAIQYIVTVKAIIERKETAGKGWAKVSDEPGSKYAYTPEIEKTVRKEVEIYEQRVDSLDMAGLVKVVNGLLS